MCRTIHEQFDYDHAFTEVSTPLATVLAARRGVCQDFAHLAIGALRMFGLPARYVSGYIETTPPDRTAASWRRRVARLVLGVGPGSSAGSTSTRRTAPAADSHVTVAWGRDYGDVAPVRGVVIGPPATQQLTVAVDVTRL